MMMMMMMMMMQIPRDDSSRDIMSYMARNVTVWEFINMKVNRSLQRPNAKIRIADMLNELEELLRHYRQLAGDELRPVPCDTDQTYPASKILVVSWHHVFLYIFILPSGSTKTIKAKNRITKSQQ